MTDGNLLLESPALSTVWHFVQAKMSQALQTHTTSLLFLILLARIVATPKAENDKAVLPSKGITASCQCRIQTVLVGKQCTETIGYFQ